MPAFTMKPRPHAEHLTLNLSSTLQVQEGSCPHWNEEAEPMPGLKAGPGDEKICNCPAALPWRRGPGGRSRGKKENARLEETVSLGTGQHAGGDARAVAAAGDRALSQEKRAGDLPGRHTLSQCERRSWPAQLRPAARDARGKAGVRRGSRGPWVKLGQRGPTLANPLPGVATSLSAPPAFQGPELGPRNLLQMGWAWAALLDRCKFLEGWVYQVGYLGVREQGTRTSGHFQRQVFAEPGAQARVRVHTVRVWHDVFAARVSTYVSVAVLVAWPYARAKT